MSTKINAFFPRSYRYQYRYRFDMAHGDEY